MTSKDFKTVINVLTVIQGVVTITLLILNNTNSLVKAANGS